MTKSNATPSGFGPGLFGKDSQTNYDVYLNLTPLMDVMSNILFFLLAAFGASAVAIFSVTVPIDARGEASDGKAEDKVTVTMRVDATSVHISCQDAMKSADELKICDASFKKDNNDYNHAALNQAFVKIKKIYTSASTLVVVPDDNLTYDVIVKLLDDARDTKMPGGQRLPLFTNVIMSSLVQ